MVSAQAVERWSWRLFALALVASLGLALWDYTDRWHSPGLWLRNLVMLLMYWAPRLGGIFLLSGLLSQAWGSTGLRRWRAAVLTLAVLVGLWSSWVEPQLLRVRTTVLTGLPAGVQPVKLALVADVHWGLFFRDGQLERLIERLNALDVDAVLVAGDWTHEPPLDLKKGLAPWARLRHPVWGVMGNHDVQAPGPPLTQALREALVANGVQLLEGRSVAWKGWTLVGLDDHWGGAPAPQVRALWPDDLPPEQAARRIVIAHQPDTLALLPARGAFLAVAGHTHGGQIWIPGLTPWVLKHINSTQPWWNGLYEAAQGHVFVTPGIGTIGLPARLAVPPTIDLIELH